MDHFEKGRRLVELREGLGWSRADLARQSGVSESTIKVIEDGRRSTGVPSKPRPMTLRMLAEALGYPAGVELLRDHGHLKLAETFERNALLPEEQRTEQRTVNRHVSEPPAAQGHRLPSEYEWFMEEVRDLVVRLADKIERGPGRAA